MRDMSRRAARQHHSKKTLSSGNEACVPSSFRNSQTVAHPADRMYQLRRSILVNLLAQAVDVHFNEVGLAIKMAIPNMLDDFTAGNKFGCVKQEEFEERKFFGRQGDYLKATRGTPPMTVQRKI